jgi:cytidylate kinase
MSEIASTIAIDGPAASGKSTVGALVAQALGYIYFDTGVMYRAVTWVALQRGIPIADEAAVTRLAETLPIEVVRPTVDDGRQYTVYAGGEDVTWELRRAETNQNVSPVSAYAGVRRALVAQQRRIAQQGKIVMVGRDIGTVVLPEAECKVYLDAEVAERSLRRYREVLARRTGQSYAEMAAVPPAGDEEYDQIHADMVRRDEIDSSRAVAPLRAAEDATVVDTSPLSVAQVVERVLALARHD